MTALTSTQKSTIRKEQLKEAAQKNGFSSWSKMLTDIKNGKAKVIKIP